MKNLLLSSFSILRPFPVSCWVSCKESFCLVSSQEDVWSEESMGGWDDADMGTWNDTAQQTNSSWNSATGWNKEKRNSLKVYVAHCCTNIALGQGRRNEFLHREI